MLTGRCYCGSVRLQADAPPEAVCYCHCEDCRRVTGAPVAAFACFPADAVKVEPDPGRRSAVPGVHRRFCTDCGSPLTAEFEYLPGQVYVPVGVMDDASALAPELHAHADRCLSWLHIADDLPRSNGSARTELSSAGER